MSLDHEEIFACDFPETGSFSIAPAQILYSNLFLCIVEDDCVRSCLIELKSFLLTKFYVNPIHRVLMYFPLFLLVPCKTWCCKANVIWIFVFFVHRIHSRKEYRCDKCTRRNFSELTHCPVVKDQWDCVLNDLEELGDKEFLVLTSQYNIEIFSYCLPLLPYYSSTFHQTNVENFQIRSEDNL